MNDDLKSNEILITMTADIVAAHVANNSVSIGDVSALITNIHNALSSLSKPPSPVEEAPQPAVPVRSSVKADYIVCLEDGKKLKMLKRHLMTSYGMTPADYRAKWSLSADYPMVAPNYTAQRQALAKKIGLGRKPKVADAPQPATPKAATKPRKRKSVEQAAT
jgi:predicted transcriptional regulator